MLLGELGEKTEMFVDEKMCSLHRFPLGPIRKTLSGLANEMASNANEANPIQDMHRPKHRPENRFPPMRICRDKIISNHKIKVENPLIHVAQETGSGRHTCFCCPLSLRLPLYYSSSLLPLQQGLSNLLCVNILLQVFLSLGP